MKHITFILVIIILFGTLISCSGEPADVPVTETTTVETTSESPYLDNLPSDLNFDGMTVRFLMIAGSEGPNAESILSEEQNGEIVNDAVYQRNSIIFDRLGADIKIVNTAEINWGSDYNTIAPLRNSVQSGSDDYDAVAGYQCVTIQAAAEGLLYDLNTLDYLDFTQPYWSSDMIENMSYKFKSYWATGDIALNYIGGMGVSYINKRIYDNFYTDSIYDMVYDGKWTLDKLYEMSEDVYLDLNGNGKIDYAEDQMGFIIQAQDPIDSLMIASGVRFTEYNSKGVPEFNLGKEKMIDFHDKVYNLLFNNKGTSFVPLVDIEVANQYANGNIFAIVNKLWHAQNVFRYMEDNFFIVPIPKYDENQTEYYTSTHDGVTIFGIPSTSKNADETSAVLEAMASGSLQLVTPAYYEISMKNKFTRDSESAVMLDYIKQNVVTDFANLYQRSVNCLLNIFRTNISQQNFASKIESLEGTYIAAFDTLIAAFDTLIEAYSTLE